MYTCIMDGVAPWKSQHARVVHSWTTQLGDLDGKAAGQASSQSVCQWFGFATKLETIDYIDKKKSKSSRDIKTYQNISRIQIAKRVKRRNRRNDETSRVGPCNSAPLHWHSPMHVELPLSNACPAAVKTNENLGKTETHPKTLIVWHVWAKAEVNQDFLCKNSTHVTVINVWLSSKAMQTLFLHVKGRGKPTKKLLILHLPRSSQAKHPLLWQGVSCRTCPCVTGLSRSMPKLHGPTHPN